MRTSVTPPAGPTAATPRGPAPYSPPHRTASGLGAFMGRAAEDIEAGGTGSVDLIDGNREETGASIVAANDHTQFRIEAGSKVGGVTWFGVHFIWWVDRCPDEVGPPPERCYCDPVYGYEGTAYGGLV
ncbi:hypothetical protein, partial [Alienimonas sp. DA493]|uniref:hypothetical protein n=1 Tax=Alienimonas sp. DA493 TaxID=3373605 RepID=UPI00375497D6